MKRILTSLALMFFTTFTAQAQMADGMMKNNGRGNQSASAVPPNSGEGIFRRNCASCHFNGGNVMNPNLPVQASSKLSDYKTFLIFVRHPTGPNGEGGAMPAFSESRLSDRQLLVLYKYVAARYGVPKP